MAKCRDCKFYDPDYRSFGTCRFNPPVYYDGRSRWPVVNDTDWCGRFEAKDNTAVAVSVETPSQE